MYMLNFQHRVAIPNPLQPPHLLNFEVLVLHYQNENSKLKGFFTFSVLNVNHSKFSKFGYFQKIHPFWRKQASLKSVNSCESGDSDDFLETRNSGGTG